LNRLPGSEPFIWHRQEQANREEYDDKIYEDNWEMSRLHTNDEVVLLEVEGRFAYVQVIKWRDAASGFGKADNGWIE
jgi:hypothetical protein